MTSQEPDNLDEENKKEFCIADYVTNIFDCKSALKSGGKIKSIVVKAPEAPPEPKTEQKFDDNDGKTDRILSGLMKLNCNKFLESNMNMKSNFKPNLRLWKSSNTGCQECSNVIKDMQGTHCKECDR